MVRVQGVSKHDIVYWSNCGAAIHALLRDSSAAKAHLVHEIERFTEAPISLCMHVQATLRCQFV